MASDYDFGAAFARIEAELIDSMMRNLRRNHLDWEDAEGFNWSQWQVEQLRFMEDYRQRNVETFGPRFTEINDLMEEALRHGYENGQKDEELRILEGLVNHRTAARDLTGGVFRGAGDAFFRVNERKLEALLTATRSDLNRAEQAVLRRANDQYRKIIFNAQMYANTGAGTVEKAVDMATKDFLMRGIDCIEYKNGARHTIPDYADMAIRTAERRAVLYGEGQKRQEWGITLVEVVMPGGHPCPQCARWRGKVLVDDVYSGGRPDGKHQLLSEAMAAGFLHPRCKDSVETFFPWEEEPEAKPLTGKELEAAEAAEKREADQQNAERMAERWGRRAKYQTDPGNRRMAKAHAAEWREDADRLAAIGKNRSTDHYNWEGTSPIEHDDTSISQMLNNAKKRGIQIDNIEEFDGDSHILDEELETIDEIKHRFKLGPEDAGNVRFYHGPEGDFGEATPDGATVLFNSNALRSRSVTRRILNEDHTLAATTERGIAAHEMGHVISSKYKLNGLEIARQAYYNITGENITYEGVIERLTADISDYCTFVPERHRFKKPEAQARYLREIIPEVMGLHWTSSTDFTAEFIRIMEEMVQ